MVEGTTGLNIKDYPFAFSIAALAFPNLLIGEANQVNILGILLIGGMIGSLLTIINPVGLIINWKYRRDYTEHIDYMLFPDFFPHLNQLIKKIIQKNFKSSLTSPAISFENNKIVGMIYFIIILLATIVRSFSPDFQNILNYDQTSLWSIIAVASAGLVGVVMVLLNHTLGINFKTNPIIIKKRRVMIHFHQSRVSQFDRIYCVTISNLALDFANLSGEGNKWNDSITKNQTIRSELLRRFLKINQSVKKELSELWTPGFSDFKSLLEVEDLEKWYSSNSVAWNSSTDLENLYLKYKAAKAISLRYKAGFAQTLCWFENLIFFNVVELYEMEQQLNNSIDSRDWYSAYLMQDRIKDKIDATLRHKNISELINESK